MFPSLRKLRKEWKIRISREGAKYHKLEYKEGIRIRHEANRRVWSGRWGMLVWDLRKYLRKILCENIPPRSWRYTVRNLGTRENLTPTLKRKEKDRAFALCPVSFHNEPTRQGKRQRDCDGTRRDGNSSDKQLWDVLGVAME